MNRSNGILIEKKKCAKKAIFPVDKIRKVVYTHINL